MFQMHLLLSALRRQHHRMFDQAGRTGAWRAAVGPVMNANADHSTDHRHRTIGAAQPVAHPPGHSNGIIISDPSEGWVIAGFQDDEALFQPFDNAEVDHAASTVINLWTGSPSRSAAPPGMELQEEGEAASYRSGNNSINAASDDGSDCDDGLLADAVIEVAELCTLDTAVVRGRRHQKQLERLVGVATRMLKRPGMQREMLMGFLEEPDMRQLFAGLAAGIDHQQLMPSQEASAIATTIGCVATPAAASSLSTLSRLYTSASGTAGAEAFPYHQSYHGGPNLMSQLADRVAGELERAGGALVAAGDWLRRYYATVFAPTAGVPGSEGALREQQARSTSSQQQILDGVDGDVVMAMVLAVAIAIFCVALMHRANRAGR